MTAPEFTVEVFQNEYLPAGIRDVNAIVSVKSSGATTQGPPASPDAAEIIIIDCSGSMGMPEAKMIQARQATSAAIDTIRDGVAFAVLAGTQSARHVYPDKDLIIADATSREAAQHALTHVRPGGGTAISRWLRLARETFQTGEATLRHAILLTDGQNVQRPRMLAAEIKRCIRGFQL